MSRCPEWWCGCSHVDRLRAELCTQCSCECCGSCAIAQLLAQLCQLGARSVWCSSCTAVLQPAAVQTEFCLNICNGRFIEQPCSRPWMHSLPSLCFPVAAASAASLQLLQRGWHEAEDSLQMALSQCLQALLILLCPAKAALSCLFLGMKLKVLLHGERSLIWVWRIVNYDYAHLLYDLVAFTVQLKLVNTF